MAAARKTTPTVAQLKKQIAALQNKLKRLSAKKVKKKKKAKKKPKRKRAPKKGRKVTKLVKTPKKKVTKKNINEGKKIREEFRSLAIKLCETVSDILGPCHYRTFQNSDSSVDLEIRISIQVNKDDLADMLLDVEDIMPFMWPPEYWYLVGLQTEDDEVTGSPTIDKRPHRAWLYPTHDLSTAMLRLRTGIIPNLLEWLTSKGRISDLIIRVHWNPWNYQPKRPRR